MKEKKILIFTHGGGRLANQLMNYAHLLAFREEYKSEFDILNLAFRPYKDEFILRESLCEHKLGNNFFMQKLNGKRYGHFQSILIRLLHLFACISPNWQSIYMSRKRYDSLRFICGKNMNINLDEQNIKKMFSEKEKTVTAGWNIRAWKLFEKHKEYIKNSIKLKKKYIEEAETFFNNNLPKDTELKVGVHIRQGDYKSWNNGQFYFNSRQYVSWIKQTEELYPDKKICFVIVSDSKQDKRHFAEIPNCIISSGKSFMFDFSLLALNELIIAPPSTFSAWAAFLGGAKLLPLCGKDEKPSKENIINNIFPDTLNHKFFRMAVH